MKLVRFGQPGQEKPGVLLDDQTRVDVSAYTRDYDENFFGDGGVAGLAEWLQRDGASAPRAPVAGGDWARLFTGRVRLSALG